MAAVSKTERSASAGIKNPALSGCVDLTDKDPEDMAALEWVFYIPERLRASVQMERLPETTSLQRKMKSMLLAGEKPGSACGILTRAFR